VDLISQLSDALDAFRWHVEADGDDEVSRAEQVNLDGLYEVVDDIHIRLDEADRRYRASHPVSIGSRGTKGNEKSLTGTPA
jgi:hypothetical protein